MTSNPWADAQSTLQDLSPREVAETHYDAIVADDRERWLTTLTAHNRDMADKRGSSPEFWWDTGRRYAKEFGVHYRFNRVEREEENRAKLFFDRLHADDSPRGRPVPIHLHREEDGWRVYVVTY